MASGETSEICWNSTAVAGISASETASWTRTAVASMEPRPDAPRFGRPWTTHTMAATAPKESQKPADVTAQGSNRQTTNAASSNDVPGVTCARTIQAAATVASISTVRCAGMPQPASSA